MNKYIGFKLIEAEQMSKYNFYMNIKGIDCTEENEEGYLIKNEDDSIEWLNIVDFENKFHKVTPKEMPGVDDVILNAKMFNVYKLGKKINTDI